MGESLQAASAATRLSHAAARFRLPWSAYARLLSVTSEEARHFYEAEALRGGWSVRQLARQSDSQFYERNALSRNKAAVLKEGTRPLPGDVCFVGRRKRLRIGDEWFRVDLIFFHRSLRCLVLIDLKLGRFTHADAGQMHVYLNYAAEQWTRTDEKLLAAEITEMRRRLEGWGEARRREAMMMRRHGR